jgi:hypothetical protein
VRSAQDLQEIGVGIWNKYVDETPQRVKLLDAFLVFLIAVGVLQFAYCVIAGNFVSTSQFSVSDTEGSRVNLFMSNWTWGFEGMGVLLTTIFHSLSTLSSLASRRLLASSSSQSACACRPTRRTRQTLRAFPMRGMLNLPPFLNPTLGDRADVHHFYRAFADFIFGSMILHFFCVNFIN